MAYEDRSYSGNAVPATLTANISNTDTSIPISTSTGWPDGTSGPFFIRIDSEVIKCSGRTDLTLSVQTVPVNGRGWDGTTAASHIVPAVVEHVFTATDADEANQHIANTGLDHHCLSEDTEILTDEGWISIDAAEEGVMAWTFNLDTEEAELESIEAVWRYPADEFPSLIELQNQDVGTLLMTPDHAVVWKRPHHGWRKRTAKSLPQIFCLPASAKNTTRSLDMPDYLIKLIAWCVTEGHWLDNGRITLAQKEGPLADRIRDLIIQSQIPFSEYKQLGNMVAWRLYAASFIYFIDENKVPRRELLNMSTRQAKFFLGECVLADGSAAGGNKLSKVEEWYAGHGIPASNIASINMQFLDWLQELAVLNEIKTRIYVDADGYCGRIVLKQTVNHTGLRWDQVTNVNRVWCVTVGANGSLIARRPGSSPFIIGNSQYLTVGRHDIAARHGFGILPTSGTPSTSVVGDTATSGSSNNVARVDHRHAREVFGSPVRTGPVNGNGSATSVSRSDHLHAGGIPIIADTAARPASPVTNETVIQADTFRMMQWTGSRWQRGPAFSGTGRTGVYVTRSAAYSIPDAGASSYILPWSASPFDSDDFIPTPDGTTTYTLTIPNLEVAGIYIVTAHIVWQTYFTQRSYIELIHTFSGPGTNQHRVSTTDEDRGTISASLDLASGDTIQLGLWQNSGAAVDAVGYLTMYRLFG